MAVEKSGLVFSVWRSWWAHLVVRRESPGPQGHPKGHNYLLGQTRSWLLGLIRNKSPQTGAEWVPNFGDGFCHLILQYPLVRQWCWLPTGWWHSRPWHSALWQSTDFLPSLAWFSFYFFAVKQQWSGQGSSCWAVTPCADQWTSACFAFCWVSQPWEAFGRINGCKLLWWVLQLKTNCQFKELQPASLGMYCRWWWLALSVCQWLWEWGAVPSVLGGDNAMPRAL